MSVCVHTTIVSRDFPSFIPLLGYSNERANTETEVLPVGNMNLVKIPLIPKTGVRADAYGSKLLKQKA